MKKLYIGTQNDGLFIIDAPPRPADGPIISEYGPNVIAKFYENDRATGELAEKIVAAYNATLEQA